MEKQKCTIHRALAELKLIDSKIEKAINELEPVNIYQKGKLIGGVVSEEEFTKHAQSGFDSVTDLIAHKNAIKAAIVDSNAKTKVTIAGKEMSVSDTITAKATIKVKGKLLAHLNGRYKNATGILNKNNEIVNSNCQKLLESSLSKDNVKVGSEDVEAIQKPYLDKNIFHLFDPIKVTDKIKALDEEIGEFETNIDYALSESNAITHIEI